VSAYLAPGFGAGYQALSNTGAVLAGGYLYTYQSGTTTPQATWTDGTQAVQNANPIVLGSTGRPANEIWLQGGTTYKFVLKDSSNAQIGVWDFIAGINDANYAGFSEWVAFGSAPTYVNATTFTVSGNQTSTLQVGRRIQFFLLGGTYYGTISTSTYSSGPGTTSIVISADSTGLDSTLYSFSYGFMSAVNSSLPITIYAPIASPTFTGTPSGPTASAGTSTTQLATTAFVTSALGTYAPLSNPAFTGVPTAPTATTGTNSTQLATTAFVNATAFNSALPYQSGNAGKFVTTDGTNASWAIISVPDYLLYAQGII
jgi:hypothetical protein